MEKVDEDANLEFKWLIKKGRGGKNKEVQFYGSFIYDGVEYVLYDCVYMYKEGLREPYIGKLTKIWENADKSKKVKVHWFFRPEEISKWLGDTKTLENEILFASGEGVGLTNISPLVIEVFTYYIFYHLFFSSYFMDIYTSSKFFENKIPLNVTSKFLCFVSSCHLTICDYYYRILYTKLGMSICCVQSFMEL